MRDEMMVRNSDMIINLPIIEQLT